jgi:hypothetical protein
MTKLVSAIFTSMSVAAFQWSCAVHHTERGQIAESRVVSQSPGPVGASEETLDPGLCDAGARVCGKELSPVHCKIPAAQAVSDKPGSEFIHGWGNNECLAKQAVVAQACELKLESRSLKQILCTPDPSEGRCPPETVFCTADFDPMECKLVKYDNQEVGEMKLVSSGSNRCVALQGLALSACQNNLDPNKLTEVNCSKTSP